MNVEDNLGAITAGMVCAGGGRSRKNTKHNLDALQIPRRISHTLDKKAL